MILPIEVLIALLVWGTLVGVDLVSLPQMMIARPLVAGTVAGAILGDIPTGLKLGVVFELLQYDILPVGAVRYPEYGPATVAAVATAHASAGLRRRDGYGERRAGARVAPAVRRAGLVQLRANARRGRRGRGRTAAARSRRRQVSSRGRAWRALLQRASLSHRSRGRGGRPCRARRRAARSDRAIARSPVRPAGLARRSPRLGWVAAIPLGSHHGGDRAERRVDCGRRVLDRLQHRPRRAAVVGTQGGLDPRDGSRR